MYGCSAGLGGEGEEDEEEEGERAPGALPPAAALLSLHVSHCSASHEMPTCSHTLALENEARLVLKHTDTHLRSSGEGIYFRVRPRSFCSHLFFSPSCVRQVLWVTSVDYKIKEGREGGREGGGRKGPCVRMEKNDCAPCGQTLTHS